MIKQYLFLFITLCLFNNLYAEGLYIGADIGASSTKAKINGEVESKTGTTADIKTFYNFDLSSNLNSDIGIGYLYNKTKGSDNNFNVTITSKLVYLDLDLKYKIGDLSIGPVLNYFTGTNTDFSEIEKGSNSNLNFGGKLAYDLTKNWRFDSRIIFSNADSQSLFGLIGLSYKLDLFNSTSKPQNLSKNDSIKKEIMPPLELDEEKPDLTLTLKSARVLFDTNVYKLDTELEKKIKRVAHYLMLNEGEWARIVISGHTDTRGSRDYNLQLSKNRAESVTQAFIKAGIPQNRISSKGYGFDRPLVDGLSPEAFEKNRRTEIEFYGIKHPNEFNKALVDILK